MSPPRITPLTHTHLPAVALLEAACFSAPWTLEQLREELSAPGALSLALLRGDLFCGYALLRCIAGEAELLRIGIDPALRRAGLGRLLLEASLEAAAQAGCGTLFLEVRESNTAARALYRRAGFAELGRRRRYYQNPEEDALLLGMELEEHT